MLLKNGSTGDDVKELQLKLGILSDGEFGNKTEAAVKKWQSDNGLTPDGVVGDTSWNKMFQQNTIPWLDLSKLKGHVPNFVIEQIPNTVTKFNVTNTLRLSHFLAQCGHESGGFKITKENLHYSANRLKIIFPKYFPGTLNESYSKNPEKIASRVYANRMGNGDELSKDGYKFRGAGYLQLTGKDNFKSFGKFIGEDMISNPELVATKYPLESAAFFFNSNKLWTICDKGSDISTITALTKKINGGTIGLDDRIKYFKKFYKLLS